jgi:hypothetical protein
MDKDIFMRAMAEEYTTSKDLTKLEDILEEYSLLLQFKNSQSEIKDTLVDFALDVIDLLELNEKEI